MVELIERVKDYYSDCYKRSKKLCKGGNKLQNIIKNINDNLIQMNDEEKLNEENNQQRQIYEYTNYLKTESTEKLPKRSSVNIKRRQKIFELKLENL